MNRVTHPPVHEIADVLASVRRKGVRLWSENGQLRFKGPEGALTQEDIDTLRQCRSQIMTLLESAASTQSIEPKIEVSPRDHRAPLALSQLARWRLCRLGERRTTRQVAKAMRLYGRLDIDALRRTVAEIVRRHDALRTRILICDGVPTQYISEPGTFELPVNDLTRLSDHSRELEVKSSIERLIAEPIDVSEGPLFGMLLLRLCAEEHVLIVAMEHIISDGVSLSILWRELFTAYTQASQGREFSLPAITIQFPQYAVWQRSVRKSWFEKNRTYWIEHLTGCQRLRFPEDKTSQAEARSGWGIMPLTIGKQLKGELREWCRLRRTTLVMAVFTAYVGLVLRWCKASEGVFQYQIDGRSSDGLQNTIGFFTSLIYLRVKLLPNDSFIDLMAQIIKEYCSVYERADPHDMSAQVPRPEFTRSTAFNWLPRGSLQIDLSERDVLKDVIRCSPIAVEHVDDGNVDTDHEPSFFLFDDGGDEISGEVLFPTDRFSYGLMKGFGRNIEAFINTLLKQPERRVNDVLLL